jgi:diacylglycerol O-acyltransferase / trehalose O-mycolyltransferase / mycolyltransferase Ag85
VRSASTRSCSRRRPRSSRSTCSRRRADLSAARASAGLLLAVLAVAAAACGGGGDGPAQSAGAARARVVAEHRIDGRLLDLAVASPALGRTAQVRLMTPAGWRADSPRRWPVLYLLHGCCDDYRAWTRATALERIGPLRRVLVVMPEGGAVGFYSNWLDGPQWERFHITELRALLERRYGAGPRRSIAGLSMGGLGALLYAARRPHLFAAAASFSGLLHPLADTPALEGLMALHTGDPGAVWGDPRRDRANWERHDPADLVAQLRGVRLYVSAGDGDPGPLDPPAAAGDPIERMVHGETRAFVASARRARLPVDADLYGAGTHRWPYWERGLLRALPLLLDDRAR